MVVGGGNGLEVVGETEVTQGRYRCRSGHNIEGFRGQPADHLQKTEISGYLKSSK